jgi:hypothetical protein
MDIVGVGETSSKPPSFFFGSRRATGEEIRPRISQAGAGAHRPQKPIQQRQRSKVEQGPLVFWARAADTGEGLGLLCEKRKQRKFQ